MDCIVPQEALIGPKVVTLQCRERDTYTSIAIGTQFDLFAPGLSAAPPSPSGVVVTLPLWRRQAEPLWRARVAETASTLSLRKTEDGRQNFWSSRVDWLFKKLTRLGMSDSEAMEELGKFRQAVIAETYRALGRTRSM